MYRECGELLSITPNNFSWRIGSKNSARNCVSKEFYPLGCLHPLRFLIDPYEHDPDSGKLLLCDFNNGVSKTYSLSIALKYDGKKESIVGEYSKPRYNGKFFSYNLARIKIKNLLEITCFFYNAETSIHIREKTDENAGLRKTEDISKKRKHEEENSEVEENKRIKARGLDALSRNLKDAFLSGEDTDVTIAVRDQEYKAHKVILKNRSPVFYSMLKFDMTEKNQGYINITDCHPSIFRDFLLYLYTGKVDSMSKGSVFELYYMSDKYDVELLKLDCVHFILSNLDIDIICDVIALATRHLEHDLLKHATSFFIDNAKEIFLTSNWQTFIKEYPIQANELIIKAFNNVTKPPLNKKVITFESRLPQNKF